MTEIANLSRRLTLLGAAALAASSAFAQSARVRLRGPIVKVDGAKLTIATIKSGDQVVELADNFAVTTLEKASAADIKPGMFIGAGALPQPDGALKAVQVTIFPESLRGAGEGHRAWDVLPESTMTNANVSEAVTGVNGATLTLSYKDGQQKLALAPDTLFLKLAPAERSEIKVGAEVSLFAEKAADGSLKAARVTVSRDGAAQM